MSLFLILLDIGIAIIMFLLGWSFYRSNGKASKFLTGYNMRSDRKTHEEEMYMCKNYGIRMMIMAVPFVIGAVIDFFKSGVGCTFAWIVWIILFVLLLIKRYQLESKK
ncbi:DUF3784 domain-containing protein [Anaerocolumna sp. MB42-C2]|uniref:DUF3784 domain-containing protein n=1 Tax=Anaerocolumna sp. MB42-C2 TaxID=3070997 RepID=UPI0027E0388C|nr:DUF3784 domain-containing protein [Anaerocolumna sp. MB42-C2]WMJ86044.1 DUF3784 domain-containing protein [Anaerocolumna sp. MB42-C2]